MKPVDFLISDYGDKKRHTDCVAVAVASQEFYDDVKKQVIEQFKSGDIVNFNYIPIFEFDINGDWQLRLKIEKK